jgi:hypothetical protein
MRHPAMPIAADGLARHDLSAAPGQGIFGAFVQSADAIAVEPLFIDFEIGAGQKVRRNLFHGEADSLGSVRETLVSQRLTPRGPLSRAEQLGRGIVIEFSHRKGDLIKKTKTRSNAASLKPPRQYRRKKRQYQSSGEEYLQSRCRLRVSADLVIIR